MKSTSSRSAKRPAAKRRSTSAPSKRAKTSLRQLRAQADSDIRRTAEHPEAELAHVVRGIVRHGLRPVPPKASISLRVDHDVLAWFKAQGDGYQTRINAVLRAFRDASL